MPTTPNAPTNCRTSPTPKAFPHTLYLWDGRPPFGVQDPARPYRVFSPSHLSLFLSSHCKSLLLFYYLFEHRSNFGDTQLPTRWLSAWDRFSSTSTPARGWRKCKLPIPPPFTPSAPPSVTSISDIYLTGSPRTPMTSSSPSRPAPPCARPGRAASRTPRSSTWSTPS